MNDKKKLIFLLSKILKPGTDQKKVTEPVLKKCSSVVLFLSGESKSIPKYFGKNNCTGLDGKIVGTRFVPPVGE